MRIEHERMSQAIEQALSDAPDLTEELGRRIGLLLFGIEP